MSGWDWIARSEDPAPLYSGASQLGVGARLLMDDATPYVMSELEAAPGQFEAAEANLAKLERLWVEIEALIPDGPAFGSPPKYEDACRAFRGILPSLPAIGGWRVEDKLFDFDEVGQMHFDVLELGELEPRIGLDRALGEQGRQLRTYRFKFDAKRIGLIRDRVLQLIDGIDALLRVLPSVYELAEVNKQVEGAGWEELRNHVAEIDALLGSSVHHPPRWSDLHRHLHFGMVADLLDIEKHDWPAVKAGLRPMLYGQHDPLPVAVADLGELASNKPTGAVATNLAWDALTAELFERLIFMLISDTRGYENAQWLQHTTAPDRGRDLSVTRVVEDALMGPRRERVIIQCKHWLSRSVGLSELTATSAQMPLWEPPRVDVLIVATTGRFTADAISASERQNISDRALRIELWPDNHIERLLAVRPHLIAEFGLHRY